MNRIPTLVAVGITLAACSPEPRIIEPAPTSPTPGLPSPPQELHLDELELELEPFADGFEAPLFLTHAGDGSGRTYVVEQGGRIRVVESDGTVRPRPFLDIVDRVTSGGEQGLLGLAFHPEDRSRVFVNYTGRGGETVVAEYRAGSSTQADPGSERVLLRIEQPYSNHNGGMLAFGPEGYLWIGTGDGGGGGDPEGNGQDPSTLLGAILRISVTGDPYGIPGGNPFALGGGGREEVWAYGLRNPWRFSFDRRTGDLWIGDVGQHELEEINVHPSAMSGAANFGWNIMEGSRCYEAPDCDTDGLVLPVTEYPTSLGCAVTGGYVYRGRRFPQMRGAYLFADYCAGQIWGLDAAEEGVYDGAVEHRELLDTGLSISSFGEDELGELYVTDLAGGGVHRVVAR